MWCVDLCDLDTSSKRRPCPRWATAPQEKHISVVIRRHVNEERASAEKDQILDKIRTNNSVFSTMKLAVQRKLCNVRTSTSFQ